MKDNKIKEILKRSSPKKESPNEWSHIVEKINSSERDNKDDFGVRWHTFAGISILFVLISVSSFLFIQREVQKQDLAEFIFQDSVLIEDSEFAWIDEV